jgi:hypothetical protein
MLKYNILLNGNHYFSPNADNETTEQYFNSLEGNLKRHSFRVFILGDC